MFGIFKRSKKKTVSLWERSHNWIDGDEVVLQLVAYHYNDGVRVYSYPEILMEYHVNDDNNTRCFSVMNATQTERLFFKIDQETGGLTENFKLWLEYYTHKCDIDALTNNDSPIGFESYIYNKSLKIRKTEQKLKPVVEESKVMQDKLGITEKDKKYSGLSE